MCLYEVKYFDSPVLRKSTAVTSINYFNQNDEDDSLVQDLQSQREKDEYSFATTVYISPHLLHIHFLLLLPTIPIHHINNPFTTTILPLQPPFILTPLTNNQIPNTLINLPPPLSFRIISIERPPSLSRTVSLSISGIWAPGSTPVATGVSNGTNA